MFYAEKITDCQIAEKGVFLSISEFLPYRRAGWSGTKETNSAADAMIMAESDSSDAWWMAVSAQYISEFGMCRATKQMLAFHCCD